MIKESGILNGIIERYEFKYLVPERLVPAIRAVALSTSHLDEHADEGGTYKIRSLYLDTDRLDLYWANEREQGDRIKLRIRTYPGKNSPVFLEVKRRVFDVIVKTRAPVAASDWRDVLGGRAVALSRLPAPHRSAAERFLGALFRHHMRPVILVEYEREAYVSVLDSYARLTIDRKIVSQRKEALDLEANPVRWMPVDHPARTLTAEPVAVLELKFERRPPVWMSSLVRRLDLIRYSFSKYCYGVHAQWTPPERRAARFAGGPPP